MPRLAAMNYLETAPRGLFPCFGNLDPPGQKVFLKVPAVSKEQLYVSAAPFPKQSFQCFRVKGLADVFVHARL